ncbi:GntR family transcriptional regulator [Amycolatopsis sulphurea]|uniref:GntR family transcriptional regulator n=1 Tax=Amycolatopsis sulphurea TaxID=76022 RepID=A0A2A9FGV4_9PSEU|nr:GntR family transcriptional regulator [Amycolatopsis sulphurea]PFG49665.1 GntR family transcriptional regulator [Amycolatopsis sulphurea]
MTPPGSERATRQGLADELADSIHTAVLNGDLPIGSWLRQEALAAQLGVSRGPVREALRKLQEVRVVELIPNRGARVLGPTVRESGDAFLLRAEIEGFAVERAAACISATDLAELSVDIQRQREELPHLRSLPPGDCERGFARSPWHVADVHFHRVIVRASGLAHVHEIVEGLRRYWPCHLAWAPASGPGILEANLAEHEGILAALERRDAATARRLMEAHNRNNGANATKWMQTRYEELGVNSGSRESA